MTRKLTRLIVLTIAFQTLVGCIPQNEEKEKVLAESTDKIQALTNTIQTLEKEKSQQKEEFEFQIEKMNAEISALNETNSLTVVSFQDEIAKLKSEYESEISNLKSSQNIQITYELDRGEIISSPPELKQLQENWRNKVSEIDTLYIDALVKLKIKFTKEGDLESAIIVRDEIDRVRGHKPESGGQASQVPSEPFQQTTQVKDVSSLSQADQEIIKNLKFSDPVISPLDTRGWTYIKGQIEVRNSSSRNTIADKLVIEARMLFKNEDKEWSVIRCVRDFGIPEKGNQTIGISFPQYNHLFEKHYADKKAEPKDTYVVVRYSGAMIFEEPAKSYSSFPNEWWKDNNLIKNK